MRKSMFKSRYTAVLFLTAGILSATELLRFDEAGFRVEGRKFPGSELVRTESIPLSGSDRKGTALRWSNPVPTAIELGIVSPASPEIGKFEEAVFSLNVEFPEPLELRRIALRLRDSKGEIFQFINKKTGTFSGKLKLDYRVADDGSASAVWGGNKNRKIDWPLRFHGIAIDCNRKTLPGARILLNSLEYQRNGEIAEFSLDTGHRLNLLLPERKEPPAILVCNGGSDEIVLGGILCIEGTSGKARSIAVSATVPAGEQARIAIPGNYSKQGWWKIRYRLVSAAGKEYSGEHRFARMIPAGPTAERATGFLFGVCSHLERYGTEKAELEALAAGLCGAKIMRLDFSWYRLQPERNRWNFAVYDWIVELLAKQGIEPQAILGFSVKWAVPPDFKPKNTAPEFVRRGAFADPALYAAYCRTVAERYKDRIRYFEIWNEPDLVGFANFDFSRYMKLLQAGYKAIRRAAPEAVIMNGGIAGARTDSEVTPRNNNGWIKFLKEDGGRHFDLFAFHGHGPHAGYLVQLELLERNRMIGKNAPRPWYSNETAETSVRIGETEQAASLFKKLLTAWAHGAVGYNWYNLREKGEAYAIGHYERHFGLITSDFEPKPAYLAFNMLAHNYGNGKFMGTATVGSGLTALRFQGKNGEKLLALWNNTREHPQTLLATLPPGTVKVDLFGEETPIAIHDGFACIPVSSTPFTLKVPAEKNGTIRIENGFLSPEMPRRFVLDPGKTCTITIPLVNPMDKPLTLNLNAVPPEYVSIVPGSRTYQLKPGEKRYAEFRLLASPAFSAPTAHPKTLQMELTLNGTHLESIPFSLVRKPAAGEPLFRLEHHDQYNSLVPNAPGNEPFYWKGPGDLSARIFLDRKGGTLRLRAEVTDDLHVQPYSGDTVWKGDNIQFGVALPEQKGFWKIGLTRLANGKPEVFCWNRPEGFPDPTGAIRLTVRRDEKVKRTFYEAHLPLSALGMTGQSISTGFRFNLILNDNDGEFREGYLAVSPGMGTGEDPGRWAIVNLE